MTGAVSRRAAALLVCATALAGCEAPPAPAGQVGAPMPDYVAPTLAGDTVALAQLRGQPVLLNVWATWCVPCRKEMPELQALHEQHGGSGLRVLGVSIDAAGADQDVRDFTGELGVTYEILRDPGERIAAVLSTQGVPTTVLIGKDGTIVWRHLGPFTTKNAALQKALAAQLKAS